MYFKKQCLGIEKIINTEHKHTEARALVETWLGPKPPEAAKLDCVPLILRPLHLVNT